MGHLNITAVVFCLIVLAVAAVFLNILCLYIIRSAKKLWKKNSNIFLFNLLFVHLFQGLFVFPMYAGKKLKVKNLVVAKIFANGFRVTYMLTFYGTCLGILLISADRFLATYLLTSYKTVVTRKRVKIALGLMWFYIIALCLIPFIDVSSDNVVVSRNGTISAPKPKFYIYQQQPEWVTFMLIVNTAIPYILIILCYIYIIRRLKVMEEVTITATRRHSRAVSKVELLDKDGSVIKLKKKDIEKHKQVTKLTLILAICYAVFWTPSFVYYPLKPLFPKDYEDSKLEQHIGFITKFLAFLDAVVAPLIYCFDHKEFQLSLLRIKSKILNQPAPQRDEHDKIESTELM